METSEGLTVFCAFCDEEAESVIERSSCPICPNCLQIYEAGQSNPKGNLVDINEFEGEIAGYEPAHPNSILANQPKE